MKRYKFIVVSRGEIPLGYLEEDPEGDLATDTAEEIERLKALASDLNDDNIELRQTLMMENAELKEKIERLEKMLDVSTRQNQRLMNQHLPQRDAEIDELEAKIERLKAEVDAALAYGYEYYKNPSMRGSSLHACRLAWKEWMVLAHEKD